MSDLNEPDHFNDDPEQGVIQVPWQQLSSDALRGIAEEFVNREGTDYGEQEVELSTKVNQVIERLKSGEAVLVYSELHESVDIKRKEEIQTEEDAQ